MCGRRAGISEDQNWTILPLQFYKCKKHFTKMLKDVGMVMPKIKGTRL